MLGFPEYTEMNRQIFKKAILMRASLLKQKERDTFNNSIEAIRVVNEISSRNVAVSEGKDVKAIFVIEVILKNYELPLHSIELLFQVIGRNIILVLKFEGEERLAVKCRKIFFNQWTDSGYRLNIEGLTLDDVWANFVSEISGIAVRDGESLDDAVGREIKNEEIRKSILLLEKEMRKIKTKTKQYDIYNKILALKEQLD